MSGPIEPVDMNGELAQQVKQMISNDKVVIFSKTYCPYCNMAKEVMQSGALLSHAPYKNCTKEVSCVLFLGF